MIEGGGPPQIYIAIRIVWTAKIQNAKSIEGAAANLFNDFRVVGTAKIQITDSIEGTTTNLYYDSNRRNCQNQIHKSAGRWP